MAQTKKEKINIKWGTRIPNTSGIQMVGVCSGVLMVLGFIRSQVAELVEQSRISQQFIAVVGSNPA